MNDLDPNDLPTHAEVSALLDDTCSCQSEQYYFGGPVHVWRDKACPIHGIKDDEPRREASHGPHGVAQPARRGDACEDDESDLPERFDGGMI